MFRFIKLLLLSITLAFSASVCAEQSKEFANLQVHYITLPTTFLQPYVAKQYGLKRGKDLAFINISILDKKADLAAVPAKLTGFGRNLMGQTEDLTFKEIKEGKAIYYIATYPFTNEEIVNFSIKIETRDKSNTLKFQHKFYND